jgi:predicted nucleic acid-binding Zn ribbon protein
MRRSNTQPLSEVLREYIREMRMDKKLKEVDALQSWEELLGKSVARYTRNIYISNKVLYVSLSSSVVKNELFMMREEIVKKLNENAGTEIIEKIVFK